MCVYDIVHICACVLYVYVCVWEGFIYTNRILDIITSRLYLKSMETCAYASGHKIDTGYVVGNVLVVWHTSVTVAVDVCTYIPCKATDSKSIPRLS